MAIETGELTTDGSCTIEAGDVLLRAPGCDGPARFSAPSRFWELWFRSPALPNDCRLQRVVRDAGRLTPLRDVCLDLARTQRFPGLAAGYALAAMLHAAVDAPESWQPAGGLSGEQRNALLRWTRDHLQHQPTPADLAAVIDRSPDHFARRFQRSFGMSPRRWLVIERIRAVARDIREDPAPIDDIAERYGFTNRSHFGRQFRDVMGSTPGRWRQG